MVPGVLVVESSDENHILATVVHLEVDGTSREDGSRTGRDGVEDITSAVSWSIPAMSVPLTARLNSVARGWVWGML